jgi:hypothetical protein
MTPEQHRLMREGIGSHVSGYLPEEDDRALEAHLAECAQCRAERDELLPVVSALRSLDPDRITAPAPEPAPDLLDRILVETVGSPVARDAASPRRTQRPSAGPRLSGAAPVLLAERRRRPVGGLLLALAAALALLAVGVGIGSQAFPRVAPAAPFETVAFEQVPPGVDASGRLIAHTWGTEIQLIVSGLEDGQAYRATFFAEDGSEVPGGTFIGVAGPMVCNLNAAILRPDVTHLRIATEEGLTVLEAEIETPSA